MHRLHCCCLSHTGKCDRWKNKSHISHPWLSLAILFKASCESLPAFVHIFCFQHLGERFTTRHLGMSSVWFALFAMCCLKKRRSIFNSEQWWRWSSEWFNQRAYLPERVYSFKKRLCLQQHSRSCVYCIASRFITSSLCNILICCISPSLLHPLSLLHLST